MTRLMLGDRSSRESHDHETPHLLESSTTRRLTALRPTWSHDFVAVNIHQTADDVSLRGRLDAIVTEHEPQVIVTLGANVSRAIDAPVSDWLAWWTWGEIPVLKFPHPSGRSRLWNDQRFCQAAAKALAQAADYPVRDLRALAR